MKKFYVTAIALIIAVSMYAQKAKFGPIVGINFANGVFGKGVTTKPQMKIGYQFGGQLEGNFGESNFGSQLGLIYSAKGYKFEGEFEENGKTIKNPEFSLNYIEMPFNIFYAFGNENVKVMPMVGIYVAYTLSAKLSGKATSGGVSANISEDLKIGWEQDNVSSGNGPHNNIYPLDLGLVFGVCAEIKSFQVAAKYDYGHASTLMNVGSNKNSPMNRVISVTVGYLFGGRK